MKELGLNKPHILAVADAIEKRSVPGLGFNMTGWAVDGGYDPSREEECGTSACIAGFSHMIAGRSKTVRGLLGAVERGEIRSLARKDMGLTTSQVSELFYEVGALDAEVVFVLRNLVETGEVDWKSAYEKAAA